MSGPTTIQVKRHVKDELDSLRKSLALASFSEVIEYLLAWRDKDSDFDRLRSDVETMKKQIALLLEQQGGAGEGDPTRD